MHSSRLLVPAIVIAMVAAPVVYAQDGAAPPPTSEPGPVASPGDTAPTDAPPAATPPPPAPAAPAGTAAAPPAAGPEPVCTAGGTFDTGGIGTPEADLARVGELVGAVAARPRLIERGGGVVETLCQGQPALGWTAKLSHPAAGAGPARPAAELHVVPFRLAGVWNSRYPSGGNDGLLWAGRGASTLVTGGIAGRAGPFSFALAPELAWSQNAWFEIRPNGQTGQLQYMNPYYGAGIDLPQRFGAGPTARWAPGQSYLRLDAGNFAMGISSENLWFGPGIRNAITMSNAGPGFPHAFLGTSRPADIWIGTAEVLVLWGRLERSGYIPNPTHPLITGLVFDYQPRWVPGLYVGLSRMQLQVWDDLRFRDWVPFVQPFLKKDLGSWYGTAGENPKDNQLDSIFARWVFPESGLELNFEWGRDDFEWSLPQFIREPDHTQMWTAGLQKVYRLSGERLVRVQLEGTHLQELRPLGNHRGVPVVYTHEMDLSYTYQGQLLGAFIGPGADSQTFAVDVIGPAGRIGGYLERIRRNDAYYWGVIEPMLAQGHDVELMGGLRDVFFAGPVQVSLDLSFAFRWARDFMHDEGNVRAMVNLAWPLSR